MRTRTLLGEEVEGLQKDGYSIVYAGRLYTYGSYHWGFVRHNLSRGASDPMWWIISKKEVKIYTESGDILWRAKVIASDADFIEYEVLN